ncbi:uncharacterized protein LOC114533436 isoform X5 [Dendronephthya gigantea]|uniref:uncharacterized protein LOC114533436 isoform X5 n=1 Tax=Dendronephthya gigantea TaxID=151771 RepID=UPI00106AE77C|nr:uncharacterized protein LOC114533436 isoform X5 [Dendronephthya gigantea]
MLDSSGSIGSAHFETMKSFVKDLIYHFKVSQNNTRVSVMSYASSASLHLTFSQAFPTRQDLYSAIDNIPYTGGGTNTAAALTLAKSHMFNTRISDTKRILIVLTDGKSSGNVAQPSQELKKAGVVIYSIGVGSGIDVNELKTMASHPVDKYVYLLQDFNEFATLAQNMSSSTCRVLNCNEMKCGENEMCVAVGGTHQCVCNQDFEGQSCEKRVEATCKAQGDPHYTTFDGKRFDFMGKCEYVLAKDFVNNTFEIRQENEPCGNGLPTCTKSLTVIFTNSTFIHLRRGMTLVNGAEVTLPVNYPDVTISRPGSGQTLVTSDYGVTVFWNNVYNVRVTILGRYINRTSGLCGTYNKRRGDDFCTYDGICTTDSVEFGNSWKVDPECDEAVEVSHPCDINPGRKLIARNKCSALTKPPFSNCSSYIDPVQEGYIEDCEYDMCACEDDPVVCYCQALEAYADDCASNVVIPWESLDESSICRTPCASAPCYNGGKCTNVGASFECRCHPSFLGDRCEIQDQCQVPYLFVSTSMGTLSYSTKEHTLSANSIDDRLNALLSYDGINRRLYLYFNNTGFHSYNLDGSNATSIPISNVSFFTVDGKSNVIYYYQSFHKTIWMHNISSGQQTAVEALSDISDVRDLEIDIVSGYLYIARSSNPPIIRYDPNDQTFKNFTYSGLAQSISVDVYDRAIYWINYEDTGYEVMKTTYTGKTSKLNITYSNKIQVATDIENLYVISKHDNLILKYIKNLDARDVGIISLQREIRGLVVAYDVDECCRGTFCSVYSTCSDSLGSFNCSCKEGYTGNGENCEDINECEIGSNNCDHSIRASCINTDGSFTCICNEDYTGDGRTCKLIPRCTTKIDLGFMLDSSGSIGSAHFETMKSFVKDLIYHFKVSQNNTRVSVMSYASSPSLHLTFSQTFPTRQDLYSAIDNIPYTGGGTNTAAALTLAKSHMFNTRISDTKRILIVLTDGKSSGNVAQPSQELKKAGVIVYSIGVGSGIDVNELKTMASHPADKYVYLLQDFNEFATLAQNMSSSTCKVLNCNEMKCGENEMCVAVGGTHQCVCNHDFEGQSCEKRVEATCKAQGDPHYTTFDGKRFDFMGKCEYVLAKDFVNNTFEIRQANEPCGNGLPTCTKSLTVIFTNSTFIHLRRGMTLVNGVKVTLPVDYPDVNISRPGSGQTLVTSDYGVTVFWNNVYNVRVTILGRYINRTSGLCGTYNKRRGDDFCTYDGICTTDSVAFGNSWKVDPECDEAVEVPHPCDINPGRKLIARNKCSALTKPPFSNCSSYIDPVQEGYIEDCEYDMCACEDDPVVCYCQALEAYADDCASNVVIPWESLDESSICRTPCASAPCYNGGRCTNVGASFECRCHPSFLGDRCEIQDQCQVPYLFVSTSMGTLSYSTKDYTLGANSIDDRLNALLSYDGINRRLYLYFNNTGFHSYNLDGSNATSIPISNVSFFTVDGKSNVIYYYHSLHKNIWMYNISSGQQTAVEALSDISDVRDLEIDIVSGYLYMARSSNPPIIRYDPNDQSIKNFTYPGLAQSISVDVYDRAIYWINYEDTGYEVMKTTYTGKTSNLNITYSNKIQVATDIENLYVISKHDNLILKYIKNLNARDVGIISLQREIRGLVVAYDVDECCRGTFCSVYSTCSDSLGSFNCSCKEGYTGNGENCEDINECEIGSNNCDHSIRASCINTNGSFACICNEDYTGDGRTCKLIPRCTTKIDLGFMLDSSGSIGSAHFETMKSFVKDLIYHFKVSQNNTRVSVMSYASSPSLHLTFSQAFPTRQDLYSAIDNIPYTGGGTNTAAALTLAKSHMFNTRISDTKRILIVLTDGKSSGNVAQPSQELKKAGVIVYSIGVGSGIDVNELKTMASHPADKYVYLLQDFNEFATLAQNMSSSTCKVLNCNEMKCGENEMCVAVGGTHQCVCNHDFEGQSCEKRVEATCKAQGDPHYTTFDGKRFDFMGKCEYVLAKDFVNNTFEIRQENEPCGNGLPTCTKSLTVIFTNSTFIHLRRGMTLVNGVKVTLPVDYPDVNISRPGSGQTLVTSDYGVTVFWNNVYNVRVTILGRYINRTSGLCGTYNKRRGDDFCTYDGICTTDSVAFGNSWKVDPECDEAVEVPHPCDINPGRKLIARNKCSALTKPPFSNCSSYIDPVQEGYIEDCEYDMCACEDDPVVCYCQALEAYADDCASNVVIPWESLDESSICRTPCASAPCYNGGRCTNVGASFECRCHPSFLGDRCEIQDQCQVPYLFVSTSMGTLSYSTKEHTLSANSIDDRLNALLSYDGINRRLYLYFNNTGFHSYNLDGSNATSIPISNVSFFTVDGKSNVIYYFHSLHKTIWMHNISSGQQTAVEALSDISDVRDLEIDIVSGYLYIARSSNPPIIRYDPNDQTFKNFTYSGLAQSISVDVYDSAIYWINYEDTGYEVMKTTYTGKTSKLNITYSNKIQVATDIDNLYVLSKDNKLIYMYVKNLFLKQGGNISLNQEMAGFVVAYDVDECCRGAFCSVYSTCSDSLGSFNCSCKEGFSGNGVNCADIDECKMGRDTCNAQASCVNTNGSFSCSCNIGYNGNGKLCSDINECFLKPDICVNPNATCLNTPGSYVCSCPIGYTGDGTFCIDINECDTGTHNCDNPFRATCINTEGSFTCVCKEDYTGDGQTCELISRCTTKSDLGFMLDSSGSIGSGHFETIKSFVKDLTDHFKISQNNTRVSVMSYASSPTLRFTFSREFPTRQDLHSAIDNIPYTGGGTNTAQGLRLAKSDMFNTNNGARILGTKRVLIVLTDGRSSGSVGLPSQELKNSGIVIYSIGVGSGIDVDELRTMASPPVDNHVYLLQNFNEFATLARNMSSTTCKVNCDELTCGRNEICVAVGDTHQCVCNADFEGENCDKRVEATCKAQGDPHYTTFDGRRFDFMGKCEYVLAKDFVNNTFEIRQANEPCGNGLPTCTKSLTVLFTNSTSIHLRRGMTLVNGAKVTLPVFCPGVNITKPASGQTLVTSDYGVTVFWNNVYNVRVTVRGRYLNRTSGLCGTYNKRRDDEFWTSNRTVLTDPVAFGNSWKVDPECANAVEVLHPCDVKPARRLLAREKCSTLLNPPFSICSSYIDATSEGYIEDCEYDMCACEDDPVVCYCQALEAYADDCSPHVNIPWKGTNESAICHTPCASAPCYNRGTCINLGPSSFQCRCPAEYRGERCESEVRHQIPYLFFSTSLGTHSYNTKISTSIPTKVDDRVNALLSFDAINKRLYLYVKLQGFTSYNLDGSDATTTSINDVDLFTVDGRTNSIIYYHSIEHKLRTHIMTGGQDIKIDALSYLSNVTDLEMDTTNGYLYIASANDPQIVRYNPSEQSKSEIHFAGGSAQSIFFDEYNNVIYWANFDGSYHSVMKTLPNKETVSLNISYPGKIEVTSDFLNLFVFDINNNRIDMYLKTSLEKLGNITNNVQIHDLVVAYDTDECQLRTHCPEKFVCENTLGSFTCTCSVGYARNGSHCEDINECEIGSNNCDHSIRATCINTDGSFTCLCNEDYTGDGRTCKLIPRCTTKSDLGFMLDSSGSIGSAHFETMKSFVKDLIFHFKVSQNKTRVSVISYASSASLHLTFSQAFPTRQDLYSAIDNIPYTGGGTNTAEGLRLAKSHMFNTNNGARVLGTKRVLIVLTDGQSSGNVAQPSQELKKEDVVIYSIGVGSGIDVNELRIMASPPVDDHVYLLQDFNEFSILAQNMSSTTCRVLNCNEIRCGENEICVPVGDTHGCICHPDFEGQSCQKRVEATCKAQGDPHYTTFDGKRFDFMGKCEYVLAKDFVNNTFEIRQANEPCGNGLPTCTKSLTVIFTNLTFIELRRGMTLVNGVKVTLPVSYPDVNITKPGSGQTLVTSDYGVTVFWNNVYNVRVTILGRYINRTSGLCGTYNKRRGDDFCTYDGICTTDSVAFGNSWKVDPECDEAVEVPHPCDINPGRKLIARNKCSALTKPPFSNCSSYINPVQEGYIEDCEYDMCACEDDPVVCYCQALEAYADDCASNVVIPWESLDESSICRTPCASAPCYNGGRCTNVGASFECRCHPSFLGDRCEIQDQCQVPYLFVSTSMGTLSYSTKDYTLGANSIDDRLNALLSYDGINRRLYLYFNNTGFHSYILDGFNATSIPISNVSFFTVDGKSNVIYYFHSLHKSIWMYNISSGQQTAVEALSDISDVRDLEIDIVSGYIYMARSSNPPIIRYDPNDQSIKNFTYPGLAQSISVDVYDRVIYWINYEDTGYEVMKTTYTGKTSKLNITYSNKIQVATDIENLYVISKHDNLILKYIKNLDARDVGIISLQREIRGLVVAYDVDECCRGTFCSVYSTCSDSLGSFNCSCKEGYTGNGENCEDINECEIGSNNCDHSIRASCINTNGSFACICNEDYTGDGRTCKLIPRCTTKIDLGFMLDSSGSIGSAHFETMKSFVKDLIYHFKVSQNNTRVSVMSYASSPSLHLTFSQAFPTRQDLYSAIDNIPYTGGGTNTAAALTLAKSHMFNTRISDTKRILIVLTDGKSSGNVAQPSQELKKAGVVIYSIGVGSGIDVNELKTMASHPVDKYVYLLQDFNEFATLAQNMSSSTCRVLNCNEMKCGENEMCVAVGGTHQCVCNQDFEGQSCEKRVEATCKAQGDPHYTTFDGKRFDFMGKCEYVLAKDFVNNTFEIRQENEPCGNGLPTCTKSLTVIFTNSTFIHLRRGMTLVNGAQVTLPVNYPDVTISRPGSGQTLVTSDYGVTVFWNNVYNVRVTILGRYINRTSGLCGTYNKRRGDDFWTYNGTFTTDSVAFGNSWKVDSECDEAIEVPHPCDINPGRKWKAREKCSTLTKPPFSNCSSYIDPVQEGYIEDCEYDMCACEDDPVVCYCQALEAYADDCASNVVIPWESLDESASCRTPCASAPCYNGGRCRNVGASFECRCHPSFLGDRCEIQDRCQVPYLFVSTSMGTLSYSTKESTPSPKSIDGRLNALLSYDGINRKLYLYFNTTGFESYNLDGSNATSIPISNVSFFTVDGKSNVIYYYHSLHKSIWMHNISSGQQTAVEALSDISDVRDLEIDIASGYLYMARSSNPPIIRYDPNDQSFKNFTYPGLAQSISVDVYDSAIYWINYENTGYEVMKTTYTGKTSKLNITYPEKIQVATDIDNLYVLSKENKLIYMYVKNLFLEQGGNISLNQEMAGFVVAYDVDECCRGTFCSVYSTCSDSLGSFNCSCKEGFFGNGVNCADINECFDPNACHPNATTCVNQIGSYYCLCDEGFIGDGQHCEVKNCSILACGKNENCIPANGIFKCVCKENHEGPHCRRIEGTCNSRGDPHYSTFDGIHYEFMGTCEYVMARDNVNNTFEIRQVNEKCGNGQPSCTKSLTVLFPNITIQLLRGSVVVNGATVSLMYMAKGVNISNPTRGITLIESDYGVEVMWNNVHNVRITVQARYLSRTSGLCGTFNRYRGDDFLTPNGTLANNAIDFGNSWKTNLDCEDAIFVDHPCKTNPDRNVTARANCSALRNAPFDACASYINPDSEGYIEDCEYDVCACDDHPTVCVCQAIEAYVGNCASRGVIINWLNHPRYRQCSTACASDPCFNGGTCTNNGSSFFCSCPVGYTGYRCEIRITPCSSAPCLNGGLCRDINRRIGGQFVCNCLFDFFGPRCEFKDTNECLHRNACHPNATTCVNQIGSYYCLCDEGFIGDGQHCEVKNCSVLACGENENCIPLNSLFKCVCKDGYEGPSCKRIEGTCYSRGDPHYSTFDGIHYEFMGTCEYVMARDNVNNTFEIRQVNEKCGNGQPSCTKSLKVLFPNITVQLLRGSVVVNDAKISLSTKYKAKGVNISNPNRGITLIESDYGVEVMWNNVHNVRITVQARYLSRTSGLCGTFNRYRGDDFLTPNGTLANNAIDFGNSWKTNLDCEDAIFVDHPCKTNPDRNATARANCSALRNAPFDACASYINPDSEGYIEDCEYDVCACDDHPTVCVCQAIEAYVGNCASRGVIINWLSHPRYHQCTTPCASDPCFNGGTCANNGSSSFSCSCPVGYTGYRCEIQVTNCGDLSCGENEICVAVGNTFDCACRQDYGGENCEKIEATCKTHGDPHYTSFDGKRFEFMGKCEYVLAKDKVNNAFEIRQENEPCGNGPPTCTKSLTVTFSNLTIKLQRGMYLVNGEETRLSVSFGDVNVTKYGTDRTVVTSVYGVTVFWNNVYNARITIGGRYFNKTSGLCGNYNEMQDDDFWAAYGAIVTDPVEFGNSWKVDSTCENATKVPHPCDVNPARRLIARENCSKLLRPPFRDCSSYINATEDGYIEDCEYDMCACEDDPVVCYCQALEAYADDCASDVAIQWKGLHEFSVCHTPCASAPCFNGGSCKNLVGRAFECSCSFGFFGQRCEHQEIIDCTIDKYPCHDNASCKDIPGSYECRCFEGFTGNGTYCNDINECERKPCHSNATCENNIGSFICRCVEGYRGDGINCQAFVECSNDSLCDENAECNNVTGHPVCTCNYGFAGNGSTCQDIDECREPNNCHPNSTCHNAIGSYNCSCNTGFEGNGTHCKDINECSSPYLNDCHMDATCSNSEGSYACYCKRGFDGNGTHCNDTDECDSGENNCDKFAYCYNLVGSYHCLCNQGYSGDGFDCRDLDECTLNYCHSNASCNNTAGSFFCTCEKGFTGNGTYCDDVDECSSHLNDCHMNGTCNNTIGSYACYCNEGFSGNGTHCNDIDECSSSYRNDCHMNATCHNTEGSYACYCNSGFNGNGTYCNDTDECDSGDNSCNEFATCHNIIGSYNCSCIQGYFGDGFDCQDVDECTLNYCHSNASCNNTAGSYSCTCKNGYTGNGTDCEDIDECSLYHLNDCHINATCNNTEGSYTCYCNEGFNGNGTYCNDTDECDSAVNNCDVFATCHNMVGSYHCSCNEGYAGDGYNCQDIDECTSYHLNDCHMNATCNNSEGSYACYCNRGFNGNGTYCNDTDECDSGENDCDEFATCHNMVGSYNCSCNLGYSGDGFDCQDVDECKLNYCHSNASCNNTAGSFFCTCEKGFTGNGRHCNDIQECDLNTDDCDGNATCTNTNGGYYCTCYDGFTGNGYKCEDIDECRGVNDCHHNSTCTNAIGSYNCSCNDGFQGNGTYCKDIDECASYHLNDCHMNATCSNTEGSYTCLCNNGFNGNGTNCNDTDECDSDKNNCDHFATCHNMIGSYHCSCDQGYSGDGFECQDVDECTLNFCHDNATCNNTAGSFFCTCNRGFTGIGTDCDDINECSSENDNCDDNANCTNIPGSFVCKCKDGFSGNGTTCENIDECLLSPCDENANCTDTNGSFECKCNNGYSGNGKTCEDVDECFLKTDNCHNHADCTNIPGLFTCECKVGFTGNGTTCENIDECLLSPCDENAICNDTTGSYECECKDGYHGNGTTCEDANECLEASRCHSDENCENYPGNYRCYCRNPGQMVSETTGRCRDVMSFQGSIVVFSVGNFDQDLFNPNSLAWYALSLLFQAAIDNIYLGSNLASQYTGSRITGFRQGSIVATYVATFEPKSNVTLSSAQEVMQSSLNVTKNETYLGDFKLVGSVNEAIQYKDYNECNSTSGIDAVICGRGGKCINEDGSYRCECDAGFEGTAPNCKDYDECDSSSTTRVDCGSSAKCINTEGSYRCECDTGYKGIPPSCTDYDECDSSSNTRVDCGNSAKCINTEGSYRCECDTGYKGTPPSCTDYDECDSSSNTRVDCGTEAKCINTDGSYRCECNTGYEGPPPNCTAASSAHPPMYFVNEEDLELVKSIIIAIIVYLGICFFAMFILMITACFTILKSVESLPEEYDIRTIKVASIATPKYKEHPVMKEYYQTDYIS